MIQDKELSIGPVQTKPGSSVKRGGKFELTFHLDASFDNPFDPQDIRVDCVFNLPDRTTVTVPGFFFTPFSYYPEDKKTKRGRPVWKIRFTPQRVGTYHYKIIVRNKNVTAVSPEGTMYCTYNNYKGFVRRSRTCPASFEFDTRKPFYPVGLNLSDVISLPSRPIPPNRFADYVDIITQLANSGGNFARLRSDSYYIPIEATSNLFSRFLGPGWYHQRACWEIDKIYEAAESRGIYILHCLYNANLLVGSHSLKKGRRQFNYALLENGGPCKTQDQFWTNKEMRRLVHNKIRYCVARWGYSPNLMGWEFFNELNGTDRKAVIRWHQSMSRYLKKLDPYDHPVTSSFHYRRNKTYELFLLPEMDFLSPHIYGIEYVPEYIQEITTEIEKKYNKPVLYGEFGLHASNRDWLTADPKGVGMHNALWATAMAGGDGIADWYINIISQYNLFHHYTSFSAWSNNILLSHKSPIQLRSTVTSMHSGTGIPRDVLVIGKSPDPFSKSTVTEFAIDPLTGRIQNDEHLQPYLHGMASRKTCPVFLLDCRRPVTFHVMISETIGNKKNKLKIFLDGTLIITKPLPAAPTAAGTAQYIKQYKNWRIQYKAPQKVSIPVPPGKHRVKVEAVAKDRFKVMYRIDDYIHGNGSVHITGQKTPASAYFWIRNRDSTSTHIRHNIQPAKINFVSATFPGFEDGLYCIEWYDSWTGQTLGTTTELCNNKNLKIFSPPFTHDIAGKATKVD